MGDFFVVPSVKQLALSTSGANSCTKHLTIKGMRAEITPLPVAVVEAIGRVIYCAD